MRIFERALVFVLVLILLYGAGCGPSRHRTVVAVVSDQQEKALIVQAFKASGPESLAAKELRRYVYVRTGELLPIISSRSKPKSGIDLIVVGAKQQPVVQALAETSDDLASRIEALEAEQYVIKTVAYEDQKVILIAGGDAVGALYGAYRFAEILGVRFYLHGDTIPDEQIAFELPDVNETGKPLFSIRGIQPFHDFPEGPDWWNTDDYKAIIAQLPKLGMNFIGLHTYPEGGVGPEPTVWIGVDSDVEDDGTVKFSSRSSYHNTLRGNWGYASKKTSDYSCGTDLIFERDDYGSDAMLGMTPWPETPEENNIAFNQVGELLRESFEYAHSLGIKTCVGTETPLIVPKVVKDHLGDMGKDASDPAVVQELYEGMFKRIEKTYPVDYYWFWTPEDWTWGNPKDEKVEATLGDFRAAIAAHEKVQPGFTLATCGWVLGPPKDRALFDGFLPKEMPISCINRNVGFSPVESGFAKAKDRPKWAIPWMEDDPALIIPQLWAGRMRRDAADALAYGCTGLLGIHWRTRVLGPNVSALAKAAWDQDQWNPDIGRMIEPQDTKLIEGKLGGVSAKFLNNEIVDTESDPLYQTVTYNVKAYQIKTPEGEYTVTLKFCEPHYNEKGKRVFGVKLQGKTVIDRLDVFEKVGKNRAMDFAFEGIKSIDGMLNIQFIPIVEYPFIAAILIEGDNFTRKINCGDTAYKDYGDDLSDLEADTRPRDLPANDFYADWALAQFGSDVAEAAGKMFSMLDGGPVTATSGQSGTNLPRPSTWVNGPGGINPDNRPWEQIKGEYKFVDDFGKLRSQVWGAGNLERFDYWLNSFRYLRGIGKLNCTWAKFNEAMEKVKKTDDSAEKKRLATELALPIRKDLVRQFEQVQRYLLATVSTTGEMGTVMNWQQHLMPGLLTKPGTELTEMLGGELPSDAVPRKDYAGEMQVIVPTVRGSLQAGEDLKLKVIILCDGKLVDAGLYFRILGQSEFERIPLVHVGRCVYSATIGADRIEESDLEYYVKAKQWNGQERFFPAAAPKLNKTVVIMN